MKILVFGDTHADIDSLLEVFEKSKEVDLVLFLGDLTFFGEGLELIELIANFPRKVIMMHGNHEHKELMRLACEPHEGIHFSDREIISVDDYDFITYGDGGFSYVEEEFEEFVERIKKHIRNPHKTILLLHAPPFDTKLDIPFANHHSGSISFRNFIEEVQPLITFSGHIHEGETLYDNIGETILHNPGPRGTIVDLEEIHKKRKAKSKKDSKVNQE